MPHSNPSSTTLSASIHLVTKHKCPISLGQLNPYTLIFDGTTTTEVPVLTEAQCNTLRVVIFEKMRLQSKATYFSKCFLRHT